MGATESYIIVENDGKIFLVTENDGPVFLRRGAERYKEEITLDHDFLKWNPRYYDDAIKQLTAKGFDPAKVKGFKPGNAQNP